MILVDLGFTLGSILFEGVCLNSRHPGPRRVWKGGSELHSMTPDPRNPGDPWDPPDLVDPRMN